MAKGGPILGDTAYSAIHVYNGMRSIFPSSSLVRNCGWDGSGTHGGVLKVYSEQPIDEKSTIESYQEATDEENKAADEMIYGYHRRQIRTIHHILTRFTYIIYRLTGKYCNFKSLRNLYKKLMR